jgi:hypothetical protein
MKIRFEFAHTVAATHASHRMMRCGGPTGIRYALSLAINTPSVVRIHLIRIQKLSKASCTVSDIPRSRPIKRKEKFIHRLFLKFKNTIIWDVTPVPLYKITGALDHLLLNVSNFYQTICSHIL